MAESQEPVLARLRKQAGVWQEAGDQRCVFLNCYQMMTGMMLVGIREERFADAGWMSLFVERFAGYYFDALAAYERDAAQAPAVWRVAHDAALAGDLLAIQQLLLGINAHINYDLVLTVDELLHPEWATLPPDQRAARRSDFDQVNDIIARTIDAVQDTVLEPAMPGMAWLDQLLGRTDEWLLSSLLSGWRHEVWDRAAQLLITDEPDERAAVVAAVETTALHRAQAISLADWRKLAALW